MEPQIAARIRDSFARQAMMATLGARLAEVTEGRVVIEAEAVPDLSQQHGFAHAGLIFAIGDSAAGYAALTTLPPGAEVLTVEMKINLLAPGQGLLTAEGRVLRAGRRLVVVAADVWSGRPDGTRRQVAALQGTMIPVEP